MSAPRHAPGGRRTPVLRARRAVIVAGAVSAVLAAAGCARAVPSTQGGPATVRADGAYLVDEAGHALYLFQRDEKGESYCTGACASVWPPYETSGRPTAGKGVANRLNTLMRKDGKRQVTYAGVPLYYYAGDGATPDKSTGEGIKQFGAEWYLVSPKNGAAVESASPSGGS